ncbi:MAG: hypothetical protein AMXMBFR13_39740 [Phycisphaerae bacterium]
MTAGQRAWTRRGLLGGAVRGMVGGYAALNLPRWAVAEPGATATQPANSGSVPVALTHGDSRAANIYDALRRIEPHIRRGLARKKRVLIKPNIVSTTHALSATHVDALEGLLEFLSPLVRESIVIAESAASGPATEGYDHYGYLKLTKKYRVELVDLDAEPVATEHLVDQRYQPVPLRLYQRLLDPDTYIISAAVMKTHDRAVVTLSLKNLVVGAAGKDPGFRWGKGSKGGNDKWLVHGGPKNEGIHFNMFTLARRLRPDLAVLDGFQGMEGNGPVGGTPVDHRVAVASTDWLAADRLAVQLMGFDFAKVGYLTFCAKAGMGEADLNRIEVLGPNPADLVRAYKPHENIAQQYRWMEG